MLSTDDVLAIHELLGHYGHVIDERQWSRMPEVFTEDLVYDATDFGGTITYGLAALREVWETTAQHPLAHHATNIVVSREPEPDGTVRVVSKGIGVGRKGRVGSVTYRDLVRREPGGWRLASREARLRRHEDIPEPS